MPENNKDLDDNEQKEKLDDILHYSNQAKKFKITIEFGYKLSPDYKRAVALAKKNPTYKEEGNQAKKFKITIEFGYKLSPDYKRAVALAKKNPTYKEEGSGEFIRHSATYTPREVDDLWDLFNVIHDWDNVEILVNHKRIPYGHQLWIPLMALDPPYVVL